VSTKALALALGIAASLSFAGLARAGCPNPCDVSVDPPVVDPPVPDCAKVSSGGETCDCDAYLAVANACTDAITVLDGSFCIDRQCDAAPPRQTSLIHWRTATGGHNTWSVRLQTPDGTVHTATVTAEAQFGGGCSIAAVGGVAKPGWTIALSVLAFYRRRVLRADE